MDKKEFRIIDNEELQSVNGGSLDGAVFGLIIGGIVGYAAGAYAYRDSIRSGSSRAAARNAADAVFVSCALTGASIGAICPI